jgi:hypothetical protein
MQQRRALNAPDTNKNSGAAVLLLHCFRRCKRYTLELQQDPGCGCCSSRCSCRHLQHLMTAATASAAAC